MRLGKITRVSITALAWLLATGAAAQPIQEQSPPPHPTPPATPEHGCIGHWQGRATDHDANGNVTASYQVTVSFRSTRGRSCGDIHYSLGCYGPLHDCAADGPTRLRATEEYTANPPGACAPEGRIEVTCTGDTMEWRWFETTGTAGMTSRATLRRAVSPPPRTTETGAVPARTPPSTGCGACTASSPAAAPGGLTVLAVLAGLIRARRRTRGAGRRRG